MNKIIVVLIFLISLSLTSVYAGIIVLEGKYQNENLYVLNGATENGVGFCAFQVSINGRVTTDEVTSSSFEIDFSQFNILPGTPVVVKIDHKDDCSPVVVNPQVLQPRPTFEVTDIHIDKNEVLKWTTTNENGSLPYIVEQFRWHKWVNIGEVKGNGKEGTHTYYYKLAPHSGENKFRVKQIGSGEISKKSPSITYISSVALPTYVISRDFNSISFSDETLFQIYDSFGNLKKQGFGKNISMGNLKKGTYFICYDNVVLEFKKKK